MEGTVVGWALSDGLVSPEVTRIETRYALDRALAQDAKAGVERASLLVQAARRRTAALLVLAEAARLARRLERLRAAEVAHGGHGA